MLHIAFGGRRPSAYKVNNVVRAFILSETFFWSGWNLINPIFAIFIASEISGGSIEIAGTAITIYLITRIVFELISGRLLSDAKDHKLYIYAISGILITGLSYISFAFIEKVWQVFALQLVNGMGFGIVSPAKYVLFAEHLDRGKESTEWGLYDAISMSGMAFTAMLGGFIAQKFGFQSLFVFSGFVILLGAIPFVLMRKDS